MTTALLIIDVQNDYFPDGRMELQGSTEASLRIKEILDFFRLNSMPVIHIQHNSVRPGASFFLPGTPGTEFHDNVKPLENEKVFIKFFPNSFRSTGLDEYLKLNKISILVITGMMTHMCVDSTVRAAFDFGYECVVAGDCCATRNLLLKDKMISAENVHNSILAALNGTFSKVLDCNDVIDYLKSGM